MSMEQSCRERPRLLETDGNVEEGASGIYLHGGSEIRDTGFDDTIIGIQEIISVPEYPTYAKGIIRLRDMIIPVIDLRVRFHKEAREYDDRTCIIVTNDYGRAVRFDSRSGGCGAAYHGRPDIAAAADDERTERVCLSCRCRNA